MIRMRSAALVGLLVCLIGAVFARGSASRAAQPLTIAIVPTEVSAQAYYALDLGYFGAHGLAVKILPMQNGAAASSAAISGSIDIVHSDTLSMVIAHSKTLPFRMLYGANVNDAGTPTNGILAVRKDAPITSAKDLAGKTIGVSSLSNTNNYALRAWLDSHGGDSRLSHYLELPLPIMADAVISGRIDAASMDSANFSSRSDLRQIASTYPSVAPKFLAGGWFATDAWVKDHPTELQAFLAAVRDASLWANAHHSDAIAIYAKYSRFSLTDLKASARPDYYTGAPGAMQPLIQPIIELAAKYSVIPSTFPADEMLVR
jgi:NitT/TauT family transport system substrate-binding protein